MEKIQSAEEFLEKENYNMNSHIDGENAPKLLKGFAIGILKYNLKQYRMHNSMVVINGGKTKIIDEITLETIKELEND